jgi:hypothetical protein
MGCFMKHQFPVSVLVPRRFAADGKLLEFLYVPGFPAALRRTLVRVRLSVKKAA